MFHAKPAGIQGKLACRMRDPMVRHTAVAAQHGNTGLEQSSSGTSDSGCRQATLSGRGKGLTFYPPQHHSEVVLATGSAGPSRAALEALDGGKPKKYLGWSGIRRWVVEWWVPVRAVCTGGGG
jgi:hypothetical protein